MVFTLAASPVVTRFLAIAIFTPLMVACQLPLVESDSQEALTCDLYQPETIARSSVDWN